jgi:hypothetical protein
VCGFSNTVTRTPTHRPFPAASFPLLKARESASVKFRAMQSARTAPNGGNALAGKRECKD